MSHDERAPEPLADSKDGGGHGKHGLLAMAACCIPMVLVFVLIGLKVI